MKKFSIIGSAAAITLMLSGCDGSNSENSPGENSTVVQNKPKDVEIKSAQASEVKAEETKLPQDSQETESSQDDVNAEVEQDPFPYTAVLSCGVNGFENLNLLGCMTGDVGSEIELNNGGNYGLYKAYNLPNEWEHTERGVEIRLAKNFSIKMQNSNKYNLMGLRVFDNKGNVLFQKQVSQWGVISLNN